MNKLNGLGLALALATPAMASAASPPPKPLFASDDLIHLAITGPISAIARSAEQSETPREASLALAGTAEAYPIRLSARGITRRLSVTCDFPPLRVEFTGAPPPSSLFQGQRRLKLVTHCRQSPSFQQYVLLEYAAYRMFNLLTPISFRVRLATVDYVEPTGKVKLSRLGYLIEDTDDLARRNGMQEAKTPDWIAATQLSPREAARTALFEYMIGNLDWSMRAGPVGQGCCHNSKLLAASPAATRFTPVPYDFDQSGLVNAPYAMPPEGIPVRSVLKRHYRGYCRHNGELIAAAAEIRARRGAMLATLGQIPQMDARTMRKAAAYLDGFFADIASDQAVAANLLKTCLN